VNGVLDAPEHDAAATIKAWDRLYALARTVYERTDDHDSVIFTLLVWRIMSVRIQNQRQQQKHQQ
jgi:hypothetical protein